VRYFTADAAVVSADTGGLYIPKRVPPKNYEYLENSAMRRAMERL
jgi:glucokinase